LGALANVVLHRFGLPSESEGDVLDGEFHREQCHGRRDSVGVGNDSLDVDAVVVEGVRVCHLHCLSHDGDDF